MKLLTHFIFALICILFIQLCSAFPAYIGLCVIILAPLAIWVMLDNKKYYGKYIN